MPVEIGQEAPDFELAGEFSPDIPGFKPTRLSEALKDGPVILHFFPAPFTMVCQVQMCTVRDNLEGYRSEGVTVWGVTGHSPLINATWAREEKLGVPILADEDHSVSEQYVGTYPPDAMLGARDISKRAVVAISSDGVVRYVWITENAGIAPPEDVINRAIEGATQAKSIAAA